MKVTLQTEPLPIKLWLDDIEDGALQQARNLAHFPFAFHHIAIMPDAHFGYGMPIGGILATEDVIIPNGVGVDIGCGMCAVKTSLQHLDKGQLKKIVAQMRESIPLGFKHHTKPLPDRLMPEPEFPAGTSDLPIIEREYRNGRSQLGTLGGGNHFIELQRGTDGRIWFMIHSGSRNLGYQVAQHYNKLAAKFNKTSTSPLPASWQLAYLLLDSRDGTRYFNEMSYCVSFAKTNRLIMCERVKDALSEYSGTEIRFQQPIQIAHNYASHEIHFGKHVMIHRKGATRANPGEIGIIPGSQGSSSYIVSGKGNPESFCSCSHGAGRKLGRKQAQKQLNLEAERQFLEKQGILHSIRGKRDLEEAAGAYKDIDRVIALQDDLVDIVDILKPLAVIKG